MVDAAVSRLGLRVIEETDRFTLLGADARRGTLTLIDADGPAAVELGEGVELALVEADTEVELDLDHIALYSADPSAAVAGWRALGFAEAPDGRLEVGGAYLELVPGDPGEPERPLLNHIGVLVDSVEDHRAAAEELGVEIADLVDAPNTVALFVWGPDRVKLEYIEHKPSFSLT